MSFNTDGKGVAVAQIVDSDVPKPKSKAIVYYDPDNKKQVDEDDIPDELLATLFGSTKARRKHHASALRTQLANDINTNALGQYHEVDAPEGDELRLIPPSIASERERDVYFVSGQSGSGKSYITAQLLSIYRKANQRIFVITDVQDEKFGDVIYLNIQDLVGVSSSQEKAKKDYENAKIRFRHRKKELADDPEALIELEIALNDMKPAIAKQKQYELKVPEAKLNKMLTNAVLVLDDYENNKDVALISYLRDHFLTKGRHTHTSMIICNHLTNFGNGSRLIMTEATNFVIFANSSAHNRRYFLERYIGFKKPQIAMVSKILKKSRWVCVDRPLDIVVSQRRCWKFE